VKGAGRIVRHLLVLVGFWVGRKDAAQKRISMERRKKKTETDKPKLSGA